MLKNRVSSEAGTLGARVSEAMMDWQADSDLRDPVTANGRDDWLGVELRHLAAVNAVASTGSFRGAAARLGYVQSSISQQIAQLERLVGHRIFERSRGAGGVVLTEAGERLLTHSQAIIARFRAARLDLSALSQHGATTVRVGLGQSAATKILPRVLPMFLRAWPEASVATTETATDLELFQMVANGSIDLAFVDLPLEQGPFAATAVLRDPYVLVVPRGAPLARLGRTPTWAEIAEVPLAGHREARYLARVESHMRAEGLEPRFVYRSTIDTAIQAMVGVIGGAALMTRLGADGSYERTELVDLSKLISPRAVALAWHSERQMSPVVAGFRDATVDICGRLRSNGHASNGNGSRQGLTVGAAAG